ncbi:MAG: bile acid:sodium symporter family protein [Actinophytocola sp.]|nr:bile acid:sodium symporter family protein [Actinophytocola sp.]
MQDSVLLTTGLPIALAIIMFGLGLALTTQDFVRVARWPKAALLALACQLFILPAVCFGLVVLFDLPATLAVGMMLLAAAPGGTTANLFSFLAGGDVALNVTLTAINTVLAVVTIPVVVNLSALYFAGESSDLRLPPGEVIPIVAIVLVPIAIGMIVRSRFHDFAERMQRPVKIGSALVLALVVIAALVDQWDVFTENVLRLGSLSLILCTAMLAVGYYVPRLAKVSYRQSIASAMEVGVQNATLAITVALSLMQQFEVGVSPAIYGVMMFLPATVLAYVMSKRQQTETTPDVAATGS